MPLPITVICGIGILFYTTVSGQTQPNTNQQVHTASLTEQKTWKARQLPESSVLDQIAYKAPANDFFNATPKYFRELVWQGMTPIENFDTSNSQKNELYSLHQYMLQDRAQYLQYIKNSWWKDPYKGIGAGILQGLVNEKYQGRKM